MQINSIENGEFLITKRRSKSDFIITQRRTNKCRREERVTVTKKSDNIMLKKIMNSL